MKYARLLFFAPLFFTTALAQQKTVTVLCGVQQEWCQAVTNAFKQKTGIDAKFVRLSAGEAVARVRSEKNNPTFDVFFGGTGDAHDVLAGEKLTASYRPRAWGDLYDNLKKNVKDAYIPLYTGALGFAVNDEVLRARNLPAPRTWKDLANPRYKGLIAMPNANTSGTAYTAITALVQIYGEGEAFELLKGIHRNVPRNGYTRPGAGAAFLAARGEVAIGITFMHDVVAQGQRGFPVRPVAPTDGTAAEIGGISLVANGPSPDLGKQFIEFALDPDTQELAASVQSYQIQSNRKTPVSRFAIKLDDVNLIDYDYAKWGDTATRERLVKRWTREVFPLRR